MYRRPLIFVEPAVLFYATDHGYAIRIEGDGANDVFTASFIGEIELPKEGPQNDIFGQDGITFWIDKQLKFTDETELNLTLTKSFFRTKIEATIRKKTSVAGFMGTRGCN
ncbi:MAG: hypothetical protein LAT67_08200 [Balneolales bacterium]|nr:hypothetical protein [Balneolales bacterium]